MTSPDYPYTLVDGEVQPMWLSDRDRPWLRDLLDEVEAAAGQPLTQLRRRFRQRPTDRRAGPRRALVERILLARLQQQERPPSRRPLRAALFALAADGVPTPAALATTAARFGLAADQLEHHLFADLPLARRVPRLPVRPDASELLWLANRLLAQGLLRRATAATLRIRGAARALLRTAWLHGCWFVPQAAEIAEWQGRSAQPQRLIPLLPLLPWTEFYELRARGSYNDQDAVLLLRTGDPLLPGPEPRAYDSQLEQRFAAEFIAAGSGWRLLREPAPLQLVEGLAFPDFACLPPAQQEPWLLEISGLRQPAALQRKLALLQHPRCLLSLPHRAIPPDLLQHPRILGHRRAVDARMVLDRLEQLAGQQASSAD